ncbi:MAG: hypothetical protein IK062_09305 [Selenomonadaceae bacterium]|nr:hypothetical protein [Selenomonadaceae bacterium]
MLAEEVKDFCSEGSTVRIFSHGENVFGVVKKLSDSSIIIMRSDNTRKMITYDKIESIDEVASVLVTKSPEIVKFASAPALETPLIYLPSINPAKVFHRDQIKEELKENYKVQKVWNIVDNMFESAKKNQSLNEKKNRLNSELSGLLSTYPINPIYLFAGDVYSAYEDWANAAFFYVKAQAYSEALNCAKKISNDYNPLMYVLSAMADDEKNPTDDYLRTFFYYSATFRRHKIVAEVLEKILNKFTEYQIKIACQGGYKILKESNNEKRLNWWEFKYNLESIRQLIEVLREIGKDEPPVKVPEIKFSVSATNQKKSKLSGKITFYKQNERYGFINSNIYFQLPQVEDYNLRFALENNGLWKKDLAVEYLIGKSYPKNAADHITLVEDEEIPSRKVEIYKGYLSNYEAFKERGYVIDHQGQTYQFAIDAILDPCLKLYLKDSVNIRTFDVEFTLKFYNGNLVVRNLILSETDSKLLRKEYRLSQDFDKPNLIPQLREPPAYFSLPPTSSYVSTTTKSITSPVIVPVVTEPALPNKLNIPIYREGEIVPYAHFIICQINTKTMIKRGTQFSQRINEEGIYIGTPHQANDDMTKFEKETIKKSPAQSKKEEWALLAKIVLQVTSQYSENIALCKANKITQSRAIKYAGRSMVSAGDYEIQTEECNIDSARFFYSEAIYMLPEGQADITNSFLRFIATFFLTREEVNKLKPVDEPLYLGYLDNCECREPEKLIASTFLFHEKMLVKVKELTIAMTVNDYWCKKLAEVILPDNSIEITEQNVWDFWLSAKNVFLQELENLRELLNGYEKKLSSTLEFDEYRKKINIILESRMLYTTDEKNIKKLLELLEKIISVATKDTFEQKEEIYKSIIDKTKSLAETIERKPTKLGYEVLREIFIKLHCQAKEDLKKLYDDTKPEFKIEVQQIAVANDKNGGQFNLFVSNKENCQTAEITEIVITNAKNGKPISPQTESIKTIRGGDHGACLYEIILSEEEKEEGYFEIAINLNYKYKISIDERDENQISVSKNFSLLKEYTPIENKYDQLKEGNGVPLDSELFYGRDDDIKKIVDMLQFENGNFMKKRGIIMYGQKRAGKTSIMDRLKERIIKKYGNSAYLIVEIGSVGRAIGNPFLGFLSKLLSRLERTIKKQQPNLYKNLCDANITFPHVEINRAADNNLITEGTRIFEIAFDNILQELEKKGGTNKYIPMFLIDEFTYFYEWIKKGEVSSDFMKFWKGFLQDYPVCSIIIGQDSMPKFIAEYQNEFACMSRFPVTFLKKQYIDKLASESILLPDGSSRYKGKAGEEALDYVYSLTAGSAYLTVIFCSNFVDYLNETKTTYITKTVIDNFINGKLLDNLTLEMFNPQIDDPSKFDDEKDSTIADNKIVLTYIANHADSARELEEDKINCIEYLSDKYPEHRSKILEQLKNRGVLSKRSNKYKIEIELLQMWLKHTSGSVV